MAGTLKFFDKNYIDSDSVFACTSADETLASNVFDNDMTSKLTSIGSNDATPEVWDITFSVARTFNRLFVGGHNIKAGSLKYWSGAAYVDFSTPIAWSNNTASSNYYEFNSVTTTVGLRLTMNTTQVANVQKFIAELRAFVELGTVETDPTSIDLIIQDKSIEHIGSTGGSLLVLFGKKYQADILFSDASDTDVTLFQTLKDAGRPFYIYPGGGVSNVERGFRVADMYYVNWVNSFEPKLKSNLLGLGVQIRMEVHES
jgi:hypothetical protein